MTIQSFIEKAIAGEYRRLPKETKVRVDGLLVFFMLNDREVASSIHEIVLDPLAWKAVGKMEGWLGCVGHTDKHKQCWLLRMHRMIDALAEGNTIEQYLETL